MLKRVLCLFVVSIFLSSCSDDTDPGVGIIYDCDDIETILEIVSTVNNTNDFILSYSEVETYYLFDFNDHEDLRISKDCVASVFERKAKSELDVRLRNSELLKFNFRNSVDLSFKHNPTGRAPLSGLIQLRASLPGKLKLRIQNKDASRDDYEYYYEEKASNQEKAVLGMYYNNNNFIEVSFYDEAEIYYVDTFYVLIGERPSYLPNIIVDTYDPQRAEPGNEPGILQIGSSLFTLYRG